MWTESAENEPSTEDQEDQDRTTPAPDAEKTLDCAPLPPVGATDDEAIVARLFARDEGGLEDLAAKYGRSAERVAFNVLHDPGAAEECKNDALLAVWRAVPPERPVSLYAFFVKIVRRIAIDRFRAQNRKKRQASEFSVALDELCETLTNGVTAEDDALGEELSREIRRFAERLPEPDRLLFLCRYALGDDVLDETIEQRAALLAVREKTRDTRPRVRFLRLGWQNFAVAASVLLIFSMRFFVALQNAQGPITDSEYLRRDYPASEMTAAYYAEKYKSLRSSAI